LRVETIAYTVTTAGPNATRAVAARLAPKLRGGETIELRSDLGGGKTTFVQGLAAALGFTGVVTSPTFTINQNYPLPSGLALHHYDLYRLVEAGIVGDELAEDMADDQAITVIEWAGLASSRLPKDRIVIDITPTGEDERELSITATGPQSAELIEEFNQ
jgi:tRNA threonylcarbamoyladenosine biosynthesis protein TsaE